MKATFTILALFFAVSASAQVYELNEVDQAPIFAKGKMTSNDFLHLYLKYPEAEYKNNIEGTVTLEYIVDKSGMVTQPKVKHSINDKLDQEALRLANLFPFYTPAKKEGVAVDCKLLFPVEFKINHKTKVNTPTTSKAQTPEKAPKKPLYVVDDKVLQEDGNINPEDIKKIRIIKGKQAVELYGNRAKDGLILIETK